MDRGRHAGQPISAQARRRHRYVGVRSPFRNGLARTRAGSRQFFDLVARRSRRLQNPDRISTVHPRLPAHVGVTMRRHHADEGTSMRPVRSCRWTKRAVRLHLKCSAGTAEMAPRQPAGNIRTEALRIGVKMKSYAQLNQSVAIHAGYTAILLGVLFGIIATSGSALAQSGPYDCSGLEGVALRNCRALNTAAASGSARPQSAQACWSALPDPRHTSAAASKVWPSAIAEPLMRRLRGEQPSKRAHQPAPGTIAPT